MCYYPWGGRNGETYVAFAHVGSVTMAVIASMDGAAVFDR